ncbi:Nitrogen regulation protein NR [Pseudomonas syringae]|uniref:nitrogen regulation protein NR(I) n=1 Tax=Pseudomonas syringae TaxID=317 RepID=UPI000EFA5BCC|nr:nitrogen regulation protein NR(I) [Pseudomonas syringae]RMN68697.1 Nitrogen regulation protein NR [Pseudomonas syringae]
MWREIKILLIDDDSQRRRDLAVILNFLGEENLSCSTQDWQQVVGSLASPREVLCVLVGSVNAPGSLQGLLKTIAAWDEFLPVLLMSENSSVELPEDLRRRVLSALEMPPSYSKLLDSLHRAQVYREMYDQARERGRHREPNLFRSLVGTSRAIQHVRQMMQQVADTDASVLILGESGTGKELVAHALHRHSPRSASPFIALNMAAIPKDLMESELFGHEKGAFTGAANLRRGRFEQADGGTLFLDEIGDMPADTQTRLLRVLADGEFYRVGGHTPVKVDVRIIAATHQNLETLVQAGKFREDLFHRLNVIRIHIPRMSDRREDIPTLAKHFLSRAAQELAVEPKLLKAETEEYLKHLPWPGNVRQLENTCRWITVMASGREVHISDLPPELLSLPQDAAPVTNWEQALRQWADQALSRGQSSLLDSAVPTFERIMIETALKHTAGRRRDAAVLLGWGRNTLTRKIKELGMKIDGGDDDEADEG